MSSQKDNKSAVDVLRDNASSINLFSQKLFLFAILEHEARLAALENWMGKEMPNLVDTMLKLDALERTVEDYKIALDMVTAWADGKDRQAYEKAIKEIPDEEDAETQAFHTTVIKASEERIAALELQLKALQDEMLGARVLLLENHIEAQGHCDGAICKAIIEGWQDEPDRQAYEQETRRLVDLENTKPAPDRAEIVERYMELVYPTCLTGRKRIREILSDFYEEVKHGA